MKKTTEVFADELVGLVGCKPDKSDSAHSLVFRVPEPEFPKFFLEVWESDDGDVMVACVWTTNREFPQGLPATQFPYSNDLKRIDESEPEDGNFSFDVTILWGKSPITYWEFQSEDHARVEGKEVGRKIKEYLSDYQDYVIKKYG